MNYANHIQYFEAIATNLVSIAHSPEDKHFATIDTMEVLEGLRNKIDGHVFYLDKYFVTWEINGDTKYKVINGAFNIVKKVDSMDFDAQDEAHNWAENLVEQVLAKIYEDSNSSKYPFKAYINNNEMMALTNKPLGYFGMRQEYVFKIPYGLCIDEEQWDDNYIPPAPVFNLVIQDSNGNILSNTQESVADEIIKVIQFPWGSIVGNIENQEDLIELIQSNSFSGDYDDLDNKPNLSNFLTCNTLEDCDTFKAFTITVELDELINYFYAPNDMKIDSFLVIVGSPTSVVIKVNNVSYMLSDVITQGSKIDIESDVVSVINLIGSYE